MNERLALQIAVGAASLVPIAGGLTGFLLGFAWLEGMPSVDAQSHGRYLSGLLLGIGLAFLLSVPAIERKGSRFRLLGAIIVLGGFGRLMSFGLDGPPSVGHLFGLFMELVVTPALVLWQARVAQRAGGAPSTGTVER